MRNNAEAQQAAASTQANSQENTTKPRRSVYIFLNTYAYKCVHCKYHRYTYIYVYACNCANKTISTRLAVMSWKQLAVILAIICHKHVV